VAASLASVRAHPPADGSLARLVLEAHDGLEGSFEELHRCTRVRMHALVLRLVRSPELALEVTQEAYLEIWQQSGRYSPERGSALSWMMVIARRRAIDRIRSVTRSVALEHRVSSGDGVEDDHADRVVARLDAARVGPLLTGLSPLQREALTLVYLQRHTSQEAASLLQVPVTTLKTRVRDGLLQMRRRADELDWTTSVELGAPVRGRQPGPASLLAPGARSVVRASGSA